jgi:YesN/AraC family two-component response regulator
MNTDAIRRFLTALSSALKIERGQLYQLVTSAEASYRWRDISSLRDLGLTLQSFAYPFNQVGKYYESVFLYRTAQFEKARQLLESVAESASAQYRARALLSLSAVEESLGRFEESLRLRLQASLGDDPVTSLEAKFGIATLRSLEGDHRAALRDLEQLLPLAYTVGKSSHPAYFKYLNSYALELSETGRTEEAEQVVKVVAASPLIGRYREWQETISEIAAVRKRPSVVAVGSPKVDSRIQRVINFMEANLHRRITLGQLARIINLSPGRLVNVFRTEVGYPPIEYLIKLRMRKARELLAATFYSVKEVMGMVGYNPGNRNGFLSHFKLYSDGLTPTQYRRRAHAPPLTDGGLRISSNTGISHYPRLSEVLAVC